DDDGGVGNGERRTRIAQKVADAGRIDQIDFLFVPLRIREAGRERMLPRDLFVVEVGDRRALVDLAEPVHHARVGERRRCELRLARSAMADERDVSDAGRIIDLHKEGTPSGAVRMRRSGGSYSAT